MDDWLKIKHWYEYTDDRVNVDALRELKKRQSDGVLIIGGIPGGFSEPRELMGDEELCCAYYEQPELIHDILDTFADTAAKVYERVCDVLTVDLLSVHEDMAGKGGPLAGPAQMREFIAPYYKRVFDLLRSSGTTLFSQDSDGDITPIIEPLLESGLNILYPCEPAAGMDVVAIRRRYGKRVRIKGGIDKFALRGSIDDVERELRRVICPEMLGGGTIFALDHRIPNGVPIENYRYYVKRGRELLGLPPAEPSPFVRMAF